MNSIYLHKDDLVTLQQFLLAFDHFRVELIADNSSGIGTTLTARLHGVDVNGMRVTVEKVIVTNLAGDH